MAGSGEGPAQRSHLLKLQEESGEQTRLQLWQLWPLSSADRRTKFRLEDLPTTGIRHAGLLSVGTM